MKNKKLVQRHNITYDQTRPTIYGGPDALCCPPLFDLACSDGSLGIFHTGGEYELAMRWFGVRPARAVREEINYMQWMGGIRRTAGDTSMPGVPEAICAVGDSAAFGTVCTDRKECFGLLKMIGDPVVDGGNDLPYCERDPRVTIDGMTIADDEQWHEMNVNEAMWNAYVYNLLWGVRDTTPANKFGHYGLWSLLGGYGDARDYVYPCDELKPKVLDWAGNPACSATAMPGITLNGNALAAEFRTNIYSTLRSLFRGLKRQLSRTRGLTGQGLNYGDFSLLLPEALAECLIACAVCFQECNNDSQFMSTERAAIALQELREGGEGYGELNFDGFRVPLIPFDPTVIEVDSAGVATQKLGMINADGTMNAMFLYRGSGTNRVLQPEHNIFTDGTFPTRDNGQVQLYMDTNDICRTLGMRREWRWSKRAPFMSSLLKNIQCNQILPDNIVSSFTVAAANC